MQLTEIMAGGTSKLQQKATIAATLYSSAAVPTLTPNPLLDLSAGSVNYATLDAETYLTFKQIPNT
jgi:hypothetical protein